MRIPGHNVRAVSARLEMVPKQPSPVSTNRRDSQPSTDSRPKHDWNYLTSLQPLFPKNMCILLCKYNCTSLSNATTSTCTRADVYLGNGIVCKKKTCEKYL